MFVALTLTVVVEYLNVVVVDVVEYSNVVNVLKKYAGRNPFFMLITLPCESNCHQIEFMNYVLNRICPVSEHNKEKT